MPTRDQFTASTVEHEQSRVGNHGGEPGIRTPDQGLVGFEGGDDRGLPPCRVDEVPRVSALTNVGGVGSDGDEFPGGQAFGAVHTDDEEIAATRDHETAAPVAPEQLSVWQVDRAAVRSTLAGFSSPSATDPSNHIGTSTSIYPIGRQRQRVNGGCGSIVAWEQR